MFSVHIDTRAVRRAEALLIATALLSGCAGGASSSASGVPTPPGVSVSPQSSPSPLPSPSPAPATVRFALDWTPNTDHTGFYVAQSMGWYRDAGIDLKVLPYGSTAPETVLAAGQADCGISFQDSLTFAVAAGAPIKSVMAIMQHEASAIAVLADSSIQRPRDLDGKTYAGFGYPTEAPTIKAVIRADGGKGDFRTVTLDSTAYQALYTRHADFTIPFTAWEGVEAQEKGIALRYFKFTEFGFPDFYQVVLACNDGWLAKNVDVARRFVGATVRGFQFAQSSPDAAAAILIAQNPSVFKDNQKLPLDSQRFITQHGLYVDAQGLVGRQTLDQWTGYSSFLYRQGLLTDAKGKPLIAPPDYGQLFTNDFLPS
ncbi:MAG: ABC transporter substrate-binding protein [Chloroflexi bacterium]|nr:MAG: ABC transporter substrate-binding protein [Chloroflexota bacterium]